MSRANSTPPVHFPEAGLVRSMAKLWPNRLHKLDFLKKLIYDLGLHRWSNLGEGRLVQEKKVKFCSW
jgi:hypothetical protein